jgi:hypothetical protein
MQVVRTKQTHIIGDRWFHIENRFLRICSLHRKQKLVCHRYSFHENLFRGCRSEKFEFVQYKIERFWRLISETECNHIVPPVAVNYIQHKRNQVKTKFRVLKIPF